ncbi:transposase [bacterium]|nr:transposase [bacterium]
MTLPARKVLPHNLPSWVRPEEAVLFVTVCCRRRKIDQLCVPDVAGGLIESVQFRHQRGDWWPHLFLVMPDHVHLLLSFPPDKAPRAVIAKWKENTAKTLRIQWQRGFFDHRLRHEESLRAKTEYVLNNPVRWELTHDQQGWPHSWWPGKGEG